MFVQKDDTMVSIVIMMTQDILNGRKEKMNSKPRKRVILLGKLQKQELQIQQMEDLSS